MSKNSKSVWRIELRNYRALRNVSWQLRDGVHVVVGPNGSGKTTLLDAIGLFGEMLRRGPAAAFAVRGSHNLVHWQAAHDTSVLLGLAVDDAKWSIGVRPDRASIASWPTESAYLGTAQLYAKDQGQSEFELDNEKLHSNNDLALVVARRLGRSAPIESIGKAFESIAIFPELAAAAWDLKALRRSGSEANGDMTLSTDGINVFTVLRNWRDKRATRAQHDRVLAGLREAFPGIIEDWEFETAGQTVAMIFVGGTDGNKRIRPREIADGVFHWLLNAVAVAGSADGGLVAIDEPERGQHPFAELQWLQFCRFEAGLRNLRIVLTTHSPVLLDGMREQPENVWLLDGSDKPQPRSARDAIDPAWLAQFGLGELYARNWLVKQGT